MGMSECVGKGEKGEAASRVLAGFSQIIIEGIRYPLGIVKKYIRVCGSDCMTVTATNSEVDFNILYTDCPAQNIGRFRKWTKSLIQPTKS